MRGTPTSWHCGSLCRGIIPAYAGNTLLQIIAPFPDGDHPRVCGEHRVILVQVVEVEGSSPRMRGTLLQLQIVLGVLGIIPAYAGNT